MSEPDMNNPVNELLEKRKCEAFDYQEIIEDMMGTERYRYAESTLLGILNQIEKTEHITEAQKQAVDNIKAKPSTRRW